MSTGILPGQRGRWVRRGGQIILFPAGPPADGAMEAEVPGGGVTATPAGVIDKRIDVFAQRALLRMNASADPGARADAAGMLAAVKSGALAGIYKEDEQVPALRAKKLGMGWWQVIPASENAVLLLGAAGEAPLIDFRDRVRSDPARLDPALRKAWASFKALRGRHAAGQRCWVPSGEKWGGISAEVSPGTRLAGIVPAMFCQAQAKPLRICIFYGYSGAKGDGTVERDLSHQLVARTLAEHLRTRFPGDQIDVICAWHKNTFVNQLISSPLTIRQIHYIGHGSPGGLFFGYHNKVAMTERGALVASFADPADPLSKLSDKEKRIEALKRDSGLMSGFFTDGISPASLAKIKANLAADALMQVWGCFAGATTHTFDDSDSYWKLFNAAGKPMSGIARHIAAALGIQVTAVTDPNTVHGMNFWFRDAKGVFHTNKRPQRLPQWLWPARKAVKWVTWNAAGTGSSKPIVFLGKDIDPATVPPGRPPKWFTDEMPVTMAGSAAPALPVCSAALVAVP